MPRKKKQDEKVEEVKEEKREEVKFGDAEGIFYDVPDEVYHACKLPSNSGIKTYNEHPALYELEFEQQTTERGMSQALQMGRGYEIMVLEPHRSTEIVTFDGKTYDSKAAVACAEANPGKVVLAEADWHFIRGLAHVARKAFPRDFDAKAQVSAVCDLEIDPGIEFSAVRVKIRMDDISFEQRKIYDLKLVAPGRAKPGEFEKMAWDLGYDTQAALYTWVMNQLFPGDEPWEFWFRVQEKRPYMDERFCAEYRFDSLSMERARSHIAMNLQLIKARSFTGYGKGTISTERFKWGR